MKRMFGGLTMIMLVVLSSFVFAAGSEISADFAVNAPKKEVVSYVPPESVMGDYLGYFILAFVALALVYFIFKVKKVSKKKKGSKKKGSPKKARRKK